jgi:hypothetical protein
MALNRAFLGVMLGLFLMPSMSAQAFTLIGSSDLFGWQTDELRIQFAPANCPNGGAEIRTALQAAVDLWNTVPNSRLKLSIGPDVTVTPAQLGACISDPAVPIPVVACDPDLGTTLGIDASQILGGALGFDDCIPSGTTLTYGYILLNADPAAGAFIGAQSQVRLNITLAHEIGHLLGLGHTSNESSLMYFAVGSKQALALSQDDMDGIAFLYPRREIGQGGIFGCGTLTAGGPDGPPPGFGLFSWMAFLLFCAGAVRMAKGRRHEPETIQHC